MSEFMCFSSNLEMFKVLDNSVLVLFLVIYLFTKKGLKLLGNCLVNQSIGE